MVMQNTFSPETAGAENQAHSYIPNGRLQSWIPERSKHLMELA
jgi:hypothetical protein